MTGGWRTSACPKMVKLLPHLTTFCATVKSGKVTEPPSMFFQTVKKAVGDPLLAAKLQFFLMIAREVKV